MTHRSRDHYAALGVPRTATPAEIRAAFRRLARTHHPDVNREDPNAERRFKRIARAYAVLGDVARRRLYDERSRRVGHFAPPGSAGPASFDVDGGPLYHSDLGHHSEFYQAGDPLSVRQAAALVGRNAAWLRRAIRSGRLTASRTPEGYVLRRRDVERLDRIAPRRSTPSRGRAGERDTNRTDRERTRPANGRRAMAHVDDSTPEQPRDANGDEDGVAGSDDLPGLLDDIPPSGDLTPGDAATRAAAPGIRQDPPEARFVPAEPASSDSHSIEVDAGSPQDYGDPNDDVVREQDDDATPRPARRDER